MPHRHRSGDAEINAVGPARVGDVPERIFRAQVHGVTGVTLEGDDCLERYRQRFRRACSAGGEHQQERVFAGQQHRFAISGKIGQFGPETEIATDNALAFGTADGDGGRAVGDFSEFGAVDRVGHHHFGAGTAQAMFDGFGAERGEQRLIHRADAPGGEHGDQQFDVARQQAGDLVAFLHALRQEEVGETRGFVLQVAERVRRAGAVAAFPEERDTTWQRMPVATLDTGIEGRQIARKCGVDGVLIIEL
ncbi:hypothetical protein PS704_06032 [Pseudomonas fluorescens]|uniref:Uncharacterized protein n=1 Tax=Pseudomonas fluorescens TaxID=294 RepID=A0A5E7FSI0_PSEFL|nr:hypothetical protein PS704_05121 [Pseudomonas fluorescens]VVO41327.1 hypothetical protein PS704_05886 [Pseudomonas fluorescens]VVO42287.1 hypothetical protein PS704_06004 [Pseudomonas fluorescens]VVO42481.1 hypothetical protein PS704_06032 [Pseudomonas fluorescens]